jgi:hypothetical protein
MGKECEAGSVDGLAAHEGDAGEKCGMEDADECTGEERGVVNEIVDVAIDGGL